MNMKCTVCEEYEPNMKELYDVIISAWVHGIKLSENYIIFRYCPWCGSPLIDEDKEKEVK